MVRYWGFYQTGRGAWTLALFEKQSPQHFSRQIRTEAGPKARRDVEAECLRRNQAIAAEMGLA